MRTSIDLSDALLEEVRELARTQKTTLRALVEEGLRRVLKEQGAGGKGPFRLRRAAYGSGGLTAGVDLGDWERIREIAYEGRGG